jgi:exopolyphosphatase/guanosine-5'-triphosphate,3'-diphosphate pyrophosphatase
MSASEAERRPLTAAAIDVGSNSVRLVIYRLEGRAIWTMFNEKVLAGLGRELATTGRLSQSGIRQALAALTRFQALLRAARPDHVFAVATAAVREASDGADFVREVRQAADLDLRVLSGEEEARYAALGVLAGAPGSSGLVGDLGGASLELVRLRDGAPAEELTLPLGPFSFSPGQGRAEFGPPRSAIVARTGDIPRNFRADTLNAVGGAWRNLALLHMRISGYPLEIVHQYEFPRREAIELARFVTQQSRGSLERIEGLSKRRMESLPHAAAVLEALIERLDIQRVVVSAYGLREGLLFNAFDRAVRAEDPLIAGCAALGADAKAATALGSALEAWLEPAFSGLEPMFDGRDRTLTAAACRLADFGARLHPDHRADLVFDQVLRAPIAGMNHPERVFLACAAFARHTAAPTIRSAALVARILSPERLQRARALGAAIRLGATLSGRNRELLAHARLKIRPAAVLVEADDAWAPMLLGEQTVKRAGTLAALLGRELKLRPDVA